MARNILVGEVALNDLLERLAFAQEETEAAALEQAKLFMAAATYRIKKMKKRQDAEAALDDIQTDASMSLRRKSALNSAKKSITEKALAEMVSARTDVRAARNTALEAKREEEWAKLLLDAYEHRRSTIKILTQFAFIEDNFRPGGEEVEKMARKRAQLKAALPHRDGDDDV